ncbi:hypothetical protein C370_07282 [Cryptococcus neoformans A1-35-8]|nr:hypothetical protein C369_07292 [Cryptococcus neoformans var. grubii A5-35-17]OXH00932.1 hypothetical protein C370_07282 [Cryptococcus neoformans var. grubii A1-35-8]
MPILDLGRTRGNVHRPLTRQHAEEPFVTVGAISTALYFGWFFVLLPIVGLIENTSLDGSDS